MKIRKNLDLPDKFQNKITTKNNKDRYVNELNNIYFFLNLINCS